MILCFQLRIGDFFLQCRAAIFVSVSGGNVDQPGHLPPQVYTESHSKVNLCPLLF